jgi:hypothetical protein
MHGVVRKKKRGVVRKKKRTEGCGVGLHLQLTRTGRSAGYPQGASKAGWGINNNMGACTASSRGGR